MVWHNLITDKVLFHRVLAGIAAFLIVIAATGCGTGIEGYRELRIRKGIAAFSFDYPGDWYLTATETTAVYTLVNICSRPVKALYEISGATSCTVVVGELSPRRPDALVAMQQDLALWQSQPEFQIIGQSTIYISGEPGQQVEFTCRALLPGSASIDGILPLLAVQMTYFTHNGIFYKIEVVSGAEQWDSGQKKIAGLLKTFTLLD